MSRIARLYTKTSSLSYYHIISHAQDELPYLTSSEKEHLLHLLETLSRTFFIGVISYAIMGNHFHIFLKVSPPASFSDEQVLARALKLFRPSTVFSHPASYWRARLLDISAFMKELNQRFSQWYNLRHSRRGHYFRDRFRSIRVERGVVAVAVCAYIDLNPVRAGVSRSVDGYRWGGYSARRAGAGGWLLSLEEELGMSLSEYGKMLEEVGRRKVDGKGFVKESQGSLLQHIVSYRADGLVYGSEEFVRGVLSGLPFRRRAKFRFGKFMAV